MSPKELTAFRMDPEVMKALRAIKERDGIPLSVQIHRALAVWVKQKGVKTKAAPRRADTRRKA